MIDRACRRNPDAGHGFARNRPIVIARLTDFYQFSYSGSLVTLAVLLRISARTLSYAHMPGKPMFCVMPVDLAQGTIIKGSHC